MYDMNGNIEVRPLYYMKHSIQFNQQLDKMKLLIFIGNSFSEIKPNLHTKCDRLHVLRWYA